MRMKSALRSLLIGFIIVLLSGLLVPLALPRAAVAQEGELASALKFIEIGFQVFDLIKFGGDIAKEHAGPKPDEQVLQEVEKQGQLIDEVQEGLNEIQAKLAQMFAVLNMQDTMQNAWDQIPNILTYYDELNREISDKDWDTDPASKDRIAEWANQVAGYQNPNIQNAVSQFHTALVTGGLGNDQRPVLLQMRDFALQELSGSNSSSSDFSTTVESTNGVNIVAERPMYFDYNGLTGGSCQAGIQAPATTQYFAEGTVRPGFQTFFCIQNPEEREADVRISYMRGDSTVDLQSFVVAPHSRMTVNAGDFLGACDGPRADFSARVDSTRGAGVIVERSVYFNYGPGWDGGHCNAGVRTPSKDIFFAEGSTRPGFDPYLCLQNPSGTDAAVSITYMKGDSTTAGQQVTIPAHSRSTVKPSDTLGSFDSEACDFSTEVRSDNGVGIVAERPMYFDNHGWTGGHCQSGIEQPENRLFFAEGTTRPGFESYLCLQNPGDRDSGVRVTYMRGDGTSAERLLSVPAHSRFTVNPSETLGSDNTVASDFSTRIDTTNGVPLVAERPIYFDYNGWTGGHDEAGIASAVGKYYFAEGTVRPGFKTYLTILNPESRDAAVKITFMKGNGSTQVKPVEVPAHTRCTLDVSDTYQATTLMDAYQRYLESFFVECLYYQVMGAVSQCNALDYLHSVDPVRYIDSASWLSGTYLPYMQDETKMFLQCVDQLVWSQADLTTGTGYGKNAVLTAPAEAQDIFMRADLMRRFARGEVPIPTSGSTTISAGLCGKLLQTHDLVAAGSTPALTARPTGGSTSYNPSLKDNLGFDWIDKKGATLKYDCWTGDSSNVQNLSLDNNWSTARYAFNDLAAGSYDIMNGSTKVTTATVTKTAFQNPMDTSKTYYFQFGYFFAPRRKNCPANDPAQWTGNISRSDSGVDTYYGSSDASKGEVGLYQDIDGSGSSDNKAYLTGVSFKAAADADVYFHFNLHLTRRADAGDSYSSYPNGFIYSHYGYLWNSVSTEADYTYKLRDDTASADNVISSGSEDATCDAFHYTIHKNLGGDKSGSVKIHVVKGRTYHLYLQFHCKQSVKDARSQVNHAIYQANTWVSDR
jgi:hypothetical protein